MFKEPQKLLKKKKCLMVVLKSQLKSEIFIDLLLFGSEMNM